MAAESDRPAGPKLRDSCDQCATAKVRCTKERPTCARCERRGHDCEYSSTKRAGRRSHAKSQADNTLRGLTPRPCCHQAQQHNSETLFLASTNSLPPRPSTVHAATPAFNTTVDPTCHVHHRQQTPGTSHAMSLLSSTSPLPGTGTEFADLFSGIAGMSGTEHLDNPLTYPSFDTFGDTSVGTGGAGDRSAGSGLFSQDDTMFQPGTPAFDYTSLLEGFGTEPAGPSVSHSPPEHNMSLFSMPTPPLAALPAPAIACGCTAQVLHFYTETSKAVLPEMISENDASKRLRDIASAVAQSNKTTEAFSGILHCKRSCNASLLVIVTLVLFNLLDRCADAIKPPASDDDRTREQSPNSSPWSRSSAMSSYDTPSQEGSLHHDGADGEDPVRVALQGLLAELLNIKRLVTSLSERLPANSDTTQGSDDATSVESSNQDCTSVMAGAGSSLPLSSNLASHALQDLSTHLRTLSRQIIGMLRAEQ